MSITTCCRESLIAGGCCSVCVGALVDEGNKSTHQSETLCRHQHHLEIKRSVDNDGCHNNARALNVVFYDPHISNGTWTPLVTDTLTGAGVCCVACCCCHGFSNDWLVLVSLGLMHRVNALFGDGAKLSTSFSFIVRSMDLLIMVPWTLTTRLMVNPVFQSWFWCPSLVFSLKAVVLNVILKGQMCVLSNVRYWSETALKQTS